MQVRFSDGTVEQYEDEPYNGGGQGDIYRPMRPGGYAPGAQPDYVVKLYKYEQADAETARSLETRVRKMIEEYNPSSDDPYWRGFFAWPEKRVVAPRVGFRMPWAHRMRRLDDYLYEYPTYWDLPPNQRGWFIGRLVVALKLSQAASRLASMGLCYADFSHRNAMVDPFEGRMMLIDCDALTIPSVLPPDVLGTPGYFAPEIVIGVARPPRVTPSILTDRHSLATVFYRWFMGHHPLEGDHPPFSLNPAEDYVQQFGDHAIFIEDPKDTSNRWKTQPFTSDVLGDEIQQLFRKTFVDGLHNPDARPQPRRWTDAFIHAYDRIIPCDSPQCDWRNFIAQPQRGLTCPICETRVTSVHSLPRVYIQEHAGTKDPDDFQTNTTGQHWVVGWPGRTLHDWHLLANVSALHANKAEPNRTPRAVFAYDSDRAIWRLDNRSGHMMRFRHTDSDSWQHWEPGKELILHDGMRLQFGDAPPYNRALVNMVGLR